MSIVNTNKSLKGQKKEVGVKECKEDETTAMREGSNVPISIANNDLLSPVSYLLNLILLLVCVCVLAGDFQRIMHSCLNELANPFCWAPSDSDEDFYLNLLRSCVVNQLCPRRFIFWTKFATISHQKIIKNIT